MLFVAARAAAKPMLKTPLLPLALLTWAAPLQDAARWTALELPELCRASIARPTAPLLVDAAHIRLDAQIADQSGRDAPLPVALLVQMLEDELRREGLGAEVYRGAPPLLVRGGDATLERLRARLADLERAAAGLEIELTVGFQRGPSDARGPLEEHHARVSSGDAVVLGTRRTQAFLAGFEVEVAANSGATRPIMGRLATGRTLHLVASRVADGVHIDGVLDLAELDGIDLFDPGSIDLGLVQEPRVDSIQIAFSAVVAEGARLELQIEGAPLAQPDWTVWIEASAGAGTAQAAHEQGFETLDLSFVSRAARRLDAVRPGAGLDLSIDDQRELQTFEQLSPSAVASAVEALRSRSDARGPRAPLYWTSELLFVPRADAAALREARQLVRAAETARLATRRVELRRGAFSASFPVTLGNVGRVVVGSERTWLVDYDVEIAPESWMPAPRVEAVFDGLVVVVDPLGEGLAASAWIAASDAPAELEARATTLGRVQLPSRTFRSAAVVLRGTEAVEGLLAAGDGDGLSLATYAEGR